MTDTVTREISFEELVEKEARHLVMEMIETELDKHNLPMPKESSLAIHIDQILKARPDITETARTRVDAKLDAYTENLKSIGVEISVIRAIDVEIEINI